MDGTLCHDRGTTFTVCGLDARNYPCLPLSAAYTSMPITKKQHEARLINKDTVLPVPEVPSSPHKAALSVIQSQSGTPGGMPRPIANSRKPVYNPPNWQHLPKSVDHLHAQTRSQDDTVVPSRTLPTPTPPLIWPTSVSFAWQTICRCILATRPTFLPLLAENNPQLTILYYTPVFALANYTTWCSQRMIESA